jgi:hypothetical protein
MTGAGQTITVLAIFRKSIKNSLERRRTALIGQAVKETLYTTVLDTFIV